MIITLAKRGPAIWFLGEPRNLVASLNMIKTTVEVDFDNLREVDQKHIIQSIQMGHIEVDANLKDLENRFITQYPTVETQPVQTTVDPRIVMYQEIEERRIKLDEKQKEQHEKRHAKTQELLKRTAPSLRVAIRYETDIELLKMAIQAEQVGKQRVMVVAALEERIRKIAVKKQKKIAREIAQRTREQMKALTAKETKGLHVIESEQNFIILTPEDLIAAVTNPSGGD